MKEIFIVPYDSLKPEKYGKEIKMFLTEDEASKFECTIRKNGYSYMLRIPLTGENIDLLENALFVPSFKPIEQIKFEQKINTAIDNIIAENLQIESLVDSENILKELKY